MAIGQELTHLGPNDFSNDSFQIVSREVCYMIIIMMMIMLLLLLLLLLMIMIMMTTMMMMIIIIMMLVVLVVVVEMTVMMIHGPPPRCLDLGRAGTTWWVEHHRNAGGPMGQNLGTRMVPQKSWLVDGYSPKHDDNRVLIHPHISSYNDKPGWVFKNMGAYQAYHPCLLCFVTGKTMMKTINFDGRQNANIIFRYQIH